MEKALTMLKGMGEGGTKSFEVVLSRGTSVLAILKGGGGHKFPSL